MNIEKNKPLIDQMIGAFARRKAKELQQRVEAKGIRTRMLDLSIIAPDPEAMLKEYGTATVAPEPWAIPSLMEMASG